MLEINNLNFAYKGKQVLFDINLHIDNGESLGILGRSGCGKTTLSRIITDYLMAMMD